MNVFKLTRSQLAKFLPDQQSIIAFENLFNDVAAVSGAVDESSVVGDSANARVTALLAMLEQVANDADINSSLALMKANRASDALERIASALELIALQPVQTQGGNTIVENTSDFTPPVQPVIPVNQYKQAFMLMGG